VHRLSSYPPETMNPTRAVPRSTVAALLGVLVAAMPTAAHAASRAHRATPGSFTGYAFDACQTPSQSKMEVWRQRSPYTGVGVYIAGVNRYCADQPNLTKTWVTKQTRRGWRLLPLTVGLQPSCDTHGLPKARRIDPNPRKGYVAARAQGRVEARSTVAASKKLGIATRSTQWFDMESFDISRTRCRESALSFLSGWTRKLNNLGYRSGVYSSAATGIRMLDDARIRTPRKYTMPDQIWVGEWNGKENTRSAYIASDGWMPHKRVHQFEGGHDEAYGGVKINVDSSFMDVGRGSVAPRASRHCHVKVDFPRYHVRRRGDRGAEVAAAQCLLRKQQVYSGHVNGRFKHRTAKAVRHFQRRHRSLRVTGEINRRTWTALLSQGSTPLMKYGAASNAVRRLQRALNAANGEGLDITGVFERTTRAATKRYQRAQHLPRSGVVTDEMWTLLRRGRR
jgi:Domain of unknown function (DUF1906)/Putative peptidoglycan binding domain